MSIFAVIFQLDENAGGDVFDLIGDVVLNDEDGDNENDIYNVEMILNKSDNVVEEEDGGWICFLGGNNSSGTKKYRGSNNSDGGNTGDGVKITGGVTGFGGGIEGKGYSSSTSDGVGCGTEDFCLDDKVVHSDSVLPSVLLTMSSDTNL
ncbi:hypothetical protein Tco_0800214 [Tanacetum coccineum]|uniref:Uncharacterized protein n=1 Tax=Tanacetum coccineum TaxID=301880 RepID=A0ABQ4ZVE1_9ASTR